MTTQISSNNIQPATLATLSPVTITSITVTDSSWTPLDDSAVSTSGGYIVITGTNFASGCNVIISSTNATSVAFVNSTTLRVQVPAMSAGTYVVYVTNINGTTAIIVNGLTYSGTPTWVTESPLPQGVTGTAISIQLSATGDTPLTYALQAGSSLPASLTLSSSGLLSGSVDGLTSETTYNFTIEAIDPQLQDSPKAFAITILAGDQLWDYVTLLLPGTTSTSIFNDDASTNNFPISIFGDTRPNNSNPYTPGYYSNYFDGTGDFLTIVGSGSVVRSSGSFTIEGWYYPTSSAASFRAVYSSGTGYATSGRLYQNNTTLSFYTGPSTGFTGSIGWTLNTWNHFAVTWDGTTTKVYVNGQQSISTTSATYSGTTDISIGESTYSPFGYISNFRIANSVIYTAAFTPPTQPLTAISGTSLLTCQSNRFIDNSTNNFTITRNGDVTVNSFAPFVPSSSTATLGSTYFDGTGDYLSASGNTAFAMGTGDFTYEAWINPISISTYWPIVGQFSSLSTGSGFFLFPINSSRQIELYYDGQTYTTFSSATVILNTWNHVAIVRSGSTITGYINGVVAGTVTYSGIFGNSSTNLEIGGTTRSGGNLWANGYISNVRILKGTALYTAAFTPPTAPLTAIANTSLLTCQTNQPVENNDFLDSSTNNLIVTRNGNTTQGTFSPYAENWSNYFDGSGDYLTVPNTNSMFSFGTGSFTVEAWVYLNAMPSGNGYPASYWIVGGGPSNADIGFDIAIGSTNLQVGLSNFTSLNINTAHGLVVGTWYHIAVVRNSNTLTAYINGTSLASVSVTGITSDPCTTGLAISAAEPEGATQGNFNGYISNLRIVKGTAVYTTAFTPSTTPLQPIPNTSLLTCRDSSFVDDSANRFAITRNGNVSVQKFGPFAGTTLPTPYYGAFFDGNGDSIQVGSSNTGVTFGTADFTIEAWIYWNSLSSESAIMFGNGVGWTFYVYPANKLQWGTTSPQTPANLLTGNTTLNTGTWYHIAVTRASGTVTLWVNGVSDGTVADSANYSASGDLRVGISHSGQFFNGYMSNVRVVKGTAVYTSTFTPSTTPLTAITNTSVLTCQSATFIDNSTNNFAITAVGNSQPTFFNPFTVTYSTLQSYSPSVFGGSMYFDGSGDDLRFNASNISNDNWTIECWVYFNNFSTTNPYVWSWGGGPANYFGLYRNSTAGKLYFTSGISGNYTNLISTTTIQAGCWYHTAIVKVGGTCSLYVNGINEASASTSFTDNIEVTVGYERFNNNANNYLNGYISDLRVIRGTALYTSNFVPTTAPLTAVRNTVLLLNGTAGGIIDVSSGNNLETVGDARLSVVQTKWPSTSMFFDGTGDRLIVPSSPNFDFTGDFTIEMWINFANVTSTWEAIISRAYALTGGWRLYKSDGNNQLVWYSNVTPVVLTTGSPLANNTWSHIAVVRNNGTVTIYIDGVNRGSAANTTSYTPGNYALEIGEGVVSSSYPFEGYIQDLRITKAARYTANFTPPTGPFLTN